MPYLPRHIAPVLREYLDAFRVVRITGARQVGKTTLARKEGGTRRYVSLDEAVDRRRCEADPTGFLRSLGDAPVLIDEVQRVPDLMLAIKREVDEDPRPGRFLLTGSAEVRQSARVHDSLAGRIGALTLRPLTQGEIAGEDDRFVDRLFDVSDPSWGSAVERGFSDYLERVLPGGYPDLHARAERQRLLRLRAYIDDVLARDVREIVKVEDFGRLRRVFSLVASGSGQLLKRSSIARDAELATGTASSWVELLAATHLIDILPGWGGSHRSRLVRMPKVYVSDTGLLAAALGATQSSVRSTPTLAGTIAETFVVQEILRQIEFHPDRRISCWHYRDRDQREIDLLLEDEDGRIVAVEVKASTVVDRSDARHIEALRRQVGERLVRGVVVYCGEHPFALTDHVTAVPMAQLWA